MSETFPKIPITLDSGNGAQLISAVPELRETKEAAQQEFEAQLSQFPSEKRTRGEITASGGATNILIGKVRNLFLGNQLEGFIVDMDENSISFDPDYIEQVFQPHPDYIITEQQVDTLGALRAQLAQSSSAATLQRFIDELKGGNKEYEEELQKAINDSLNKIKFLIPLIYSIKPISQSIRSYYTEHVEKNLENNDLSDEVLDLLDVFHREYKKFVGAINEGLPQMIAKINIVLTDKELLEFFASNDKFKQLAREVLPLIGRYLHDKITV